MRLIKILLVFVILLSMINIVSAYEVYEGEIDTTGYSQTTNSVSYVSSTTFTIDAVGVKDGGLATYLTSVTLMMDIGAWAGNTSIPYYKEDVTYQYDSETVGTGYMYYWLQSTDADPEYEYAYVKCYFADGLDLTSGHKIVNIVGFTGDAKFKRGNSYNIETSGYNERSGFIGKYSSTTTMFVGEGTHKAFHTITFYNNYSYYYDKDLFTFYLNRNDANPSELTINNSYVDLIAEDGLQGDPAYVYSDDLTNDTWDIDILDSLGSTHEFQIDFIPFVESVGTIELNQTSYTDPDLVQIDAELTTYDFDNHNYYIIAEMSEDTNTWSLLLGDANDTFVISNVTESRTLDIADEYYEYPIWIKAILRDYNKVTGVYSDIAESNEVLYNPPIAYDYTLSGTVIDAGTGTPIEGATVSAVGPITTSDTTSSAGRFTLYLAGGSYTITGSKSGYVSNVNEDIVIACNVSLYGIYLTQTSYTNGTMNGIIKDADTGESIQDVHLIFTNATDRIDAYTSTGGYYTASGFAQSTSYDIRAIKSGYYSYNGSVTIAASGGTHKSFDMVQINYSVTPTATVLDTYPDGEGHAWTNDEIVTMLRIVVPGVFMMMFIFLLLAVLMGVGGNNGGNGGQGMGMKELWQR